MNDNDDLKYPNLRESFPEELIEECIIAAKKSPEHFKEWLLTIAHTYAINLLEVYHKRSMMAQLEYGRSLSSLDILEQLEAMENAKNEKDTETV